MSPISPEIRLRLIDVDEWALWRELRLQALAESPDAFGTTLAEWQGEGDTEQRWRARLLSAQLNFVAYVNDSAVGMASGIEADEPNAKEIISMWVAPSARGHRVGDALLLAIVAWAQSEHAADLMLSVVTTNARAKALYRGHGFIDAGMDTSSVPPEQRMVLRLSP